MVNEDQYKETARPFIPSKDVYVVIYAKGVPRRPRNALHDNVALGGNALGLPAGDDLYTWANFRLMIEGEYGMMLQDAIDNHPCDPMAALMEWMAPYLAAHGIENINLTGWEGYGFPAPEDEPMGGLIVPEEPPEF